MMYYSKLAFILFFGVTVCHGATSHNGLVKHGSSSTVVLDATTSEPPRASNTGNVDSHSTNSYSSGSGAASSGGGEQHASCTCESSAGSNNDRPTGGTPYAGSWQSQWGGGGSSESGKYDSGYGSWRGYGNFGGSYDGSNGGGYNP